MKSALQMSARTPGDTASDDHQVRISSGHGVLLEQIATLFGISKKRAAELCIDDASKRAIAGKLEFTLKPKAVAS